MILLGGYLRNMLEIKSSQSSESYLNKLSENEMN